MSQENHKGECIILGLITAGFPVPLQSLKVVRGRIWRQMGSGIDEEAHLTGAETLDGRTQLMDNNHSGSRPGHKYPDVSLLPLTYCWSFPLAYPNQK